MNIVVTGANRGIGLEFVRQYLARGDHALAGCRKPADATALAALAKTAGGRLRVLPCDVASDTSVAEFAREIGDTAVDVLINNAGMAGDWARLDELDMPKAMQMFSTNALGALRVTRSLLPNLERGTAARIASISSGMGSIGDNGSGGAYGYRLSKAALDMAARNLAHDLRPRGIISVAVNPGWVKTDMGGANAPTAVEDSVRGMIAKIDALTLDDSGRFIHWNGPDFPW